MASCAKRTSLAERLNRLGFDETVIKYGGNKFCLANPPSEVAISLAKQVEVAGDLWAVCIEHEAENPGILRGTECSLTDHTYDMTLISVIRNKACHVWLDAFLHYKDRWPDAQVMQLLGWVLEACESLAKVQQYSTMFPLADRVKNILFDRLDGMVNENKLSGSSEELGESCENSSAQLKQLLLKVRILIWRALASMKMNLDTSKRDYHEIDRNINLWLRKIGDPNLKTLLECQCYRLKMDAGMRLLKSEEYDHALEIFCNLMMKSNQIENLLGSREVKNQNAIMEDISMMNKRLLIGIFWSRICHESGEFSLGHGHDAISKITERILEAFKQLSGTQKSEQSMSVIQLEFCKELDGLLEGQPTTFVKGVVFLCSKLMIRKPCLIPLFGTYASHFDGSKGHRKAFLLGVLANICELLRDSRFYACSDTPSLLLKLISNKIVLDYLQNHLRLTLSIFNLIWNAAVDCDMFTNKHGFLEVALVLGEVLQDPALVCQTLFDLSYLNLREGKLDVAIRFAKQAEQFDPSGDFRLIILEIMLEKSEVEIESTKSFVKSTFDLVKVTLDRAIYLVCGSLEKQNFLMAGILLDVVLAQCLDTKGTLSDPGILPILFQNFIALASEIRHPYLMSKVFHWMDKWNSNLVDIVGGGLHLKIEAANVSFKRYLAHEAFNLAQNEFKDGNFANTMTAALFASGLLDSSLTQEVQFQSLLGSQSCFILACYVAHYLDDGPKAAQHLIMAMTERSCRIQKSCPDQTRHHLERLSFYEKYLVLLHHIFGENDASAYQAYKSIESQMSAEMTLDILHEVVKISDNQKETCLLALSTSLKRLNGAAENSQMYSDILRMLLRQLNPDMYIQVITEFHHLYKSLPKGSFQDQFIVWLYTSCWNFAMCQLKQVIPGDTLAEKAISISLEGFQRAQVFCHADLEILRERAQRLIGTNLGV